MCPLSRTPDCCRRQRLQNAMDLQKTILQRMCSIQGLHQTKKVRKKVPHGMNISTTTTMTTLSVRNTKRSTMPQPTATDKENTKVEAGAISVRTVQRKNSAQAM